jgi:hypothetical protein
MWNYQKTDRHISDETLRCGFHLEHGESSLSTDGVLTFPVTIEATKYAAKAPWLALLAVPVAMCLLSIVLAAESPAFANAVALVGLLD